MTKKKDTKLPKKGNKKDSKVTKEIKSQLKSLGKLKLPDGVVDGSKISSVGTKISKLAKNKKVSTSLSTKKQTERILFLDIETSLALMANFSLWSETNYKNIVQDWYIISASWKWLGEKKTYSVSVLDDPSNLKNKGMLNPFNDRVVVDKLIEILNEADIVCYHNGDRFDLKKINTRIIYHKLKPLPKIPTIDTLKVAKRIFGFTSNRLDYISKYLGFSGKIDTEKGMWMDVLKGNLQSIKKMVKYNERDTIELENVYLRFRPFIDNHPSLRPFSSDACSCPNCKSTVYQKRGTTLKTGGKFQRYQCQDCGRWWTSSEKVN